MCNSFFDRVAIKNFNYDIKYLADFVSSNAFIIITNYRDIYIKFITEEYFTKHLNVKTKLKQKVFN